MPTLDDRDEDRVVLRREELDWDDIDADDDHWDVYDAAS